MTEPKNTGQQPNAPSFQPLVLASLGLGVFALTFYSIEGMSAFGLSDPDALSFGGRPGFTAGKWCPVWAALPVAFLP